MCSPVCVTDIEDVEVKGCTFSSESQPLSSLIDSFDDTCANWMIKEMRRTQFGCREIIRIHGRIVLQTHYVALIIVS